MPGDQNADFPNLFPISANTLQVPTALSVEIVGGYRRHIHQIGCSRAHGCNLY